MVLVRNRKIDQWNRKGHSETAEIIYINLVYDEDDISKQLGKDGIYNKHSETTGYMLRNKI